MLEATDTRSQLGSHGGFHRQQYHRDDWETKSRKEERKRKSRRRQDDDTKSVRSYKTLGRKSVVGLQNRSGYDPMEVLSVVEPEDHLRERAGRKDKKSKQEIWDTVSTKAAGIQHQVKSKIPKREKPLTTDEINQWSEKKMEYEEEFRAMCAENPEYTGDFADFTLEREREADRMRRMLEVAPEPRGRGYGGRPRGPAPPPHPARYPLPTTPLYNTPPPKGGGFINKILGKKEQQGHQPPGSGGVVRLSDAMSTHKEYSKTYSRMQGGGGRRGGGGGGGGHYDPYDNRGRYDQREDYHDRERSRSRDRYPPRADEYQNYYR